MSKRGENIYKRRDGRWEGRLLKPDGRYRYIYGKSYKEVKEKKQNYKEIERSNEKKGPEENHRASVLFERWLEQEVLHRVKPSTYESYYRCLHKYIIPYFKKTGKDQINMLSAEQFVQYIYENTLLSESYKKKIITIFKVALKEILKDQDTYEPVLKAVKLPKTDIPPVEVFSIREQRLIEAEALKSSDSRALGIILCFYTGIRLGELCALKWGNIDFEERTMSIVKTVSRTKNFQMHGNKTKLVTGTPKSCKSIRKIPLPNFIINLAGEIKNIANMAENNYILTGSQTPLDPRTYQRLFKKVLKSAGVKDRKFHAIRHTFATRALETGIDIKTLSEILGHSNALITLNVYAHSLMEQKIAAIEKLSE